MKNEKYPTMTDPNGFVTLTDAGHSRWMDDHNPEGWDDATWAAYVERISTDPGFAKRVKANMDQRHEWAEQEVRRQIGTSRVDHGFRIDVRREVNIDAVLKFPRCNPLSDGWIPSSRFDPIASLTKNIRA